eukprot:7380147-Prymnesium_polylepis.2
MLFGPLTGAELGCLPAGPSLPRERWPSCGGLLAHARAVPRPWTAACMHVRAAPGPQASCARCGSLRCWCSRRSPSKSITTRTQWSTLTTGRSPCRRTNQSSTSLPSSSAHRTAVAAAAAAAARACVRACVHGSMGGNDGGGRWRAAFPRMAPRPVHAPPHRRGCRRRLHRRMRLGRRWGNIDFGLAFQEALLTSVTALVPNVIGKLLQCACRAPHPRAAPSRRAAPPQLRAATLAHALRPPPRPRQSRTRPIPPKAQASRPHHPTRAYARAGERVAVAGSLLVRASLCGRRLCAVAVSRCLGATHRPRAACLDATLGARAAALSRGRYSALEQKFDVDVDYNAEIMNNGFSQLGASAAPRTAAVCTRSRIERVGLRPEIAIVGPG